MKRSNKNIQLPLAVKLALFFPVFTWSLVAEESPVEHILITSTYSEKSLATAPSSASIIIREQLELRQVFNLADALRGTTGINLSGVGFQRKGIEIRGMDTDQTLILIDGERTSGAADLIAHSNYELSWIVADDIERIEVVRGPISALYGSEALGGVINIITRQPTTEWRGSVSATGGRIPGESAGDNYQLQATASGSLIKDKLSLRLSSSKQRQDDIPNKADVQLSDTEANEVTSTRAQLLWQPVENQRVNITYLQGKEYRWRDTITGSTYYQFQDDIDRTQFSISHKGFWQWGDSSVRLYRSELERENIRTENIAVTSPSTITEDVIESHVGTVAGKHHLRAGGQWHRQRLQDSNVNLIGDKQSVQKSLFIQDDYTVTDNISLLLGSRFDHHDAFGWESSPRAYLVYQPTDNWVLKGGYGEGFKAPSLKQLSPEYQAVGGGGRFTIYGNPDLSPERNKAFELSAGYYATQWHVVTTVFETQATDLIETVCVSGCDGRGAIRNYHNVSRADFSGIEFSSGFKLLDSIDISANLSYLDTENRETGAHLNNKPQISGYLALSWQPVDKLSTQLRLEHIGKQYLDGGRLPSYRLLSFSGRYRVNQHISLRAGVDNLTDVYLPDKSEDFNFIEPGRSLYFGAILSF